MRLRVRSSLLATLFLPALAQAQQNLPPGAMPVHSGPEPVARVPLTPLPAGTAPPLAPVPPAGLATPTPAATATSGRTWTAPEPGEERQLELPAYTGPAGTPLGDPALFRVQSPLRRAWFLREYYRRRGDEVSAQAALSTFADLRVDEGIDDAGAVATALALESGADVRDRKPAPALEAASAAVALAPDLASTQFALARARAAAGDWGGAFSSLSAAAGASPDNLRSRVRLVGNTLAIALAGSWLAFGLFLLVAFLRHGRFLAHDFGHALGDKLPFLLTGPIFFLFLAFPVIFGLGLLPLAAWITLALWLKLERTERILAALFLLLGAATPLVVDRAAGYFAFEEGESGRLYAASHEDEVAAAGLADLTAYADASGDPDALLTLGNLHLRAGRYGVAEGFYRRTEEKGLAVAAQVGEGAVKYGEGDVPAALALWQKAASGSAPSFEAHFDLFRVYNELTELEKANAEIATARVLDGRAFDRLKDQTLPSNRKLTSEVGTGQPIVSASYLNRLLVVDAVSDDRLLERALQSGEARAMARISWRRLSPGLSMEGVTVLFLGALALCGLMTAAFRGVIPARGCPRCGRRICLRCDGPPLEGDYCTQCYHAFLHPEGTDPRERARKEREVLETEARRGRLRRLLSLLLPGGGHLLGGDTLRGAAILVLASLAFARLLAWRGLLRPTFPDGAPGWAIVWGLSLLLFLGTWIAGLAGHTAAEVKR